MPRRLDVDFYHDESLKKISEASKSRVGTKRSEESRRRMSEAQKRLWADPEHRRRMSDAHKKDATD